MTLQLLSETILTGGHPNKVNEAEYDALSYRQLSAGTLSWRAFFSALNGWGREGDSPRKGTCPACSNNFTTAKNLLKPNLCLSPILL